MPVKAIEIRVNVWEVGSSKFPIFITYKKKHGDGLLGFVPTSVDCNIKKRDKCFLFYW